MDRHSHSHRDRIVRGESMLEMDKDRERRKLVLEMGLGFRV